VKVYITKYALTEGIKEFDGKQVSDKIALIGSGSHSSFVRKPHWHLTIEEAKAQALKMVRAKIASMDKQIAKLLDLESKFMGLEEKAK
jgi:hypothetical protein